MIVSNVPISLVEIRRSFSFSDLLSRAKSKERASWVDIQKDSGVYIVIWNSKEDPIFLPNAGTAVHANTAEMKFLRSKWMSINKYIATNILYIGKGDNLRNRVRCLFRFGVGKARNHRGGEWLWQISKIEKCEVIVQTCPQGKQLAFENSLLVMFKNDHGDYPLANRKGPENNERWLPIIS